MWSKPPFFSFGNVILTPHLAGIEEALRVLKGDLPLNLVNPAVVAQYRRRFP